MSLLLLQSHILLKNENNVLPLDTKKRTFLVGPMSGGYQCQSGYEWASEGCSSLSGSLSKAANWTNFTSASGCEIQCPQHENHGKKNCTDDLPALNAAVAEAALADQVGLTML